MGNPELPPTPAELLENESVKQPIVKGLKSFIGLPFRKSVPAVLPRSSNQNKRGVLLCGDLEKWTNYFGQWKPRSFEIIPGVLLVYDSCRDGHRDHIPLLTCTVKSVRQLEVIVTRTDGGPLKLRFSNAKIRSKWLSTIAKAKQMAWGGTNYLLGSPKSSSPTNGSYNEGAAEQKQPLATLDQTVRLDEEAVAINCLIDSLSKARSDYYSTREEVDVITRRLLEHLRDASPAARDLTCSMLIEQERLDSIVQKHFAECNAAIQQEQVERAEMQQCLRRQARENYRLGHKLQKVPRNAHAMSTRNSVSRRASGEEFFDMDECASSSPTSSEDEESAVDPVKTMTTSAGDSTATPEPADIGDAVAPVEQLGLPRPPIKFRTKLPKPRTEIKTSLWSLLKDFIGKDLSRIALPVTFNEPNSLLQRLAEDYQYSALLEKAALTADPGLRLLYVAAFTVTPWQSAIGRTYKPFNPLLGETYEMTHRGFKFMAEQVGHHPPVTAYAASGQNYEAHGHIGVDTKFTGKALEVQLIGPITLRVRHPQGHWETFSYRRPRLIVNNIIFGRISLDVAGTHTITNHTTGGYAVIEYPRSGWWGDLLHVVRAAIFSADGACLYRVSGQWSNKIYFQEFAQPCDPRLNGTSSVEAEEDVLIGPVTTKDHTELRFSPKNIDFVVPWKDMELLSANLPSRLLWAAEPRPANSHLYYSFGAMTFELNDLNEEYYETRKGVGEVDRGSRIILPRTDSRYRVDQRALEEGDVDLSNSEKVRLEEKQRAAARLRGNTEANYKPRWFAKSTDRVTGEPTWSFDPNYWRRSFSDVPNIMGEDP